jgi:hypothetical protein
VEWRNRVQGLSSEELARFKASECADLDQYVGAIKKSATELNDKSKALAVARFIKPLFEVMNLCGPIVTELARIDPTFSSLVLGGITCILSLSSKFIEFYGNLVGTLHDMFQNLAILMDHRALYPDHPQVRVAVIDVLGCVLDFCVKASTFIMNNRAQLLTRFKPLLNSFQKEFDDPVKTFFKALKLFERAVNLASDQAFVQERDEQSRFRNQMTGKTENVLTQMSSNTINLSVLAQNQLGVKRLQDAEAHGITSHICMTRLPTNI